MYTKWVTNLVLLRGPDTVGGIRLELAESSRVSLRSCRTLLTVVKDDTRTNSTH